MNDTELIPTQKYDLKVRTLAHHIEQLIGNPVNIWAVAASIESIGIREDDVESDYGFESLYELSGYIYDHLKSKKGVTSREKLNTRKTLKDQLKYHLSIFCKYYGLGLLGTIPLLSQIVALFLFGYSLWAWVHLNKAQATMIAIGVIGSFIITGGFVQVLSREINRYVSMNNYKLAAKITLKLFLLAGGVIIAGGVAMYLGNLLFYFYPINMATISLVYGIFIGFMILLSSILYTLSQIGKITIGVIAGTAIVIIGIKSWHLSMYVSQWLGLGITIIILGLYTILFFYKKIKRYPTDTSDILPHTEVIYYRNYRFFIYGILYFLFIFLDRILAWSVHDPPISFVLWFNTPYELGMDWAILGLIATVGVIEYNIHLFSDRMMEFQKGTSFNQINDFNRYFLKLYVRQVVLLIITSVISVSIAFFGVHSFEGLGDKYPLIKDFFASPVTIKVFWLASLGYALFSIGILHTLYFFTLARPAYTVYSLFIALLCNFFTGYVCSRLIAPQYAIIGLITGALVFTVLTGWFTVKTFRRMDYYYFSAY